MLFLYKKLERLRNSLLRHKLVYAWLAIMLLLPVFIAVFLQAPDVKQQGHKVWLASGDGFTPVNGYKNIHIYCPYGVKKTQDTKVTLALRFMPEMDAYKRVTVPTHDAVGWQFSVMVDPDSPLNWLRGIFWRNKIYTLDAIIGKHSNELKLSPKKESKESTNSQNYNVRAYDFNEEVSRFWTLTTDEEKNLLVTMISYQPFDADRKTHIKQEYKQLFHENSPVNLSDVELFLSGKADASLVYYFDSSSKLDHCSQRLKQFSRWCKRVASKPVTCDCYQADFFKKNLSLCANM